MLSSGQTKRNKELLATLLPEVAALAWRHLGICQDAGIDLVVVQALRTKEQQDALYAQGRTAPGRVVTDARPGFSWHNFGRAYDVVIAGEGGRLIWGSPLYRKVGELGQGLGLGWGGRFTSIRGDLGHFEYHPGLTLADARARSAMKEEA